MAETKTDKLTVRIEDYGGGAIRDSRNMLPRGGTLAPRPAFRVLPGGIRADGDCETVPCGAVRENGGEVSRLAVLKISEDGRDTLKFLFVSESGEEPAPDYAADGVIESCAVYSAGETLYCLSRESGGNKILTLAPGAPRWEEAEPYLPTVRTRIRMSGEAGAVYDRAAAWENGDGVNALCRRYRALYVFASANDLFSFELPYPVFDGAGELPGSLAGEKITAVLTGGNGAVSRHEITLNPGAAAQEEDYAADGLKMTLRGRNIVFLIEPGQTADDIRSLFPGEGDDMEIEAPLSAGTADYNERLAFSMTRAARFGGFSGAGGGARLFLYGGSLPGTGGFVLAGDAAEPLYFPESGFCPAGEPWSPVTALGRQGGALFAFKENEIYRLRDSGGNGFVAEEISPTGGCDCPETLLNCRNRLVWLSSAGEVRTLRSSGGGEYGVFELSRGAAEELRSVGKAALKSAVSGVWRGHIVIFAGKLAFVTDSETYGYANAGGVTKSGVSEPDFYIWEPPGDISPAVFFDGLVLLSAGGGTLRRYALSAADTRDLLPGGDERPIPAYFITAPFDFGRPFLEKFIECGMFFLAGEEGETVDFSLLTERGEHIQTGVSLRGTADDGGTLPHRVLPAAPPRFRFALKLSCAGAFTAGKIGFAARSAGPG